MKNKAILEFENNKLTDFHSWYTPDVITYLTYLNKQTELLRYTFFDGDFKAQFQSINMLKNGLKQGFNFICKEPGIGQNHFIFGILIKNKLIFINPVGETAHKDFYEIAALIKKDYNLDIYLSNTIIQKDTNLGNKGIVSCGPICVELIRYISLLSKKEILSFLETSTSVTIQTKYELEYKEINIKALLPESLNSLETTDLINYQHLLEEIRKQHLKILAEDPLITNLRLEEQNEFLENNCINHPIQVEIRKFTQESNLLEAVDRIKEYLLQQKQIMSKTVLKQEKTEEITSSSKLNTDYSDKPSIVNNPGGGDCGVYALIDAIHRNKKALPGIQQEIRTKITNTIKNFILLYSTLEEYEKNPATHPSQDKIVDLYKNIFGQGGFGNFKFVIKNKLKAPLKDKDTNDQTRASLRSKINLVNNIDDWDLLREVPQETLLEIFRLCNSLDIDVQAIIRDHNQQDLQGILTNALDNDTEISVRESLWQTLSNEYYSYASKQSIWLNNSELIGYLLTQGYIQNGIDMNCLDGTIIQFINNEGRIIGLFNNAQDNSAHNVGQARGVHWQAVLYRADMPTNDVEATQEEKKDDAYQVVLVSEKQTDLCFGIDISQPFTTNELRTLHGKDTNIDKDAIITTEQDYSNLLDAIDILRIKKILKHVEKLKRGDIDPILSNLRLANPEKIDPVYRDTSDEGIIRSEYIMHYVAISNSINVLSERAGSIKIYFANFPWDDLEIVSHILKNVVRDNNIELYQRYKSLFDMDLHELELRLKNIIQVSEIRNPKVRKILQANSITDGDIENYENVTNQYEMLHTLVYSDFAFIHADDLRPRGLNNIRKKTEFQRDSSQVDRILNIIHKIENFDVTKIEGREALLSSCFMLGEYAKAISINTKDQNTSIPFKQLREFRNTIHKLDILADARKLFAIVEQNEEIFGDIKNYVVELRNLFKEIRIVSDREPSDSDRFLPLALHSSRLDHKTVERMLYIIQQAIPTSQREAAKNKLEICRDILEGRLPIPVHDSRVDILEKLIARLFKQEFECECELVGNKGGIIKKALFKNYDAVEEKRERVKQIKENIEFFKEQTQKFKVPTPQTDQEPSQEVKCFRDFESQFQHHTSSSSSTYTEKQRELHYVKDQTRMLLVALEKISCSIDMSADYQVIRHQCQDTQFHYAHLFQLLVIGEAIQNLVGKDIFLRNASAILLVEFDHLKWVRNGLMHDLDISELGSVASYFGNDMMSLSIREHGAKAYDSREYLNYIKDEIELALTKIEGSMIDDETGHTTPFAPLILKQLEQAHKASEYEVETLLVRALGEEIDHEWYSGHDKAKELLSKSRSLDLVKIYENKDAILEFAAMYNIEIVGFFGRVVKWGVAFDEYRDNSGVFVKNSTEQELALFKRAFTNLVNYRFLIINRNHVEEIFCDSKNPMSSIVSFESDVRNKHSFTSVMNGVAVYIAIKNNASSDEVDQLLQDDCNLDLVIEGYSLVQHACHVYTRNSQTVGLLLKLYGTNPDVQDKRGDTLAHYAAEENDVELLKLLKSKGANFDIVNHNGKTALDCTAMHYVFNKEAYEYLLQFVTTNVVEKIVLAIKHQDLGQLRQYLNHLQDRKEILNTETEKYGLIGHIACTIGNLDIINILEENGCDLSLITSEGTTALEEACYGDNADLNPRDRLTLITKLIEINGINITNVALHNSLYCSDLSMLEFLLNKGTDPNVLCSAGFTPLLVLINQPRVSNKDLKAIKLLLDKGANILINDKYVGNSLHLAAERGHLNVVQLLLDYATQHNKLNDLLQTSPKECWVCSGLTAHQIALKYNKYAVAKILEQYFTTSADSTYDTNIQYPQPFSFSMDLDSKTMGDSSEDDMS